MRIFFLFQHHVDSSADVNVQEKHVVSFFTAEVAMLAGVEIYMGLEEKMAGGGPTRNKE